MDSWKLAIAFCLIIGQLPAPLLGASVHGGGHHSNHGHGHPDHAEHVHGHSGVETDHSTTPPTNQSKAVYLPHVLRISAFNIKTFGRAKMSDAFTAGIIRDIVKRYDVILIQEIRDSSGEALLQLWDMVGRSIYGLEFSDRLGRSSYKEQYAYFYKYSRVTLVASHQYDDGPDDYTDEFEREPFSVRLRPVGGSWDLALVGVHVKPGDAVKEIDLLLNVYDDVRKTWTDVQNVIIMGDLNADCSYASESKLSPLPIYNQNQMFIWPLGFDADTTTSTNTDCAYDRFILSGPELNAVYIPGSADIYQFELTHRLSYTQMTDVSDHYPIELELY